MDPLQELQVIVDEPQYDTTQHNVTFVKCYMCFAMMRYLSIPYSTLQCSRVHCSTGYSSTDNTVQYNTIMLVYNMQCFQVGYPGICHASLVFSVYTRAFRRVCIQRKYKWHVSRYSTRKHCITTLSHASLKFPRFPKTWKHYF